MDPRTLSVLLIWIGIIITIISMVVLNDHENPRTLKWSDKRAKFCFGMILLSFLMFILGFTTPYWWS